MKTRAHKLVGRWIAVWLSGVVLSASYSPCTAAENPETVKSTAGIESIAVVPLLKGRFGVQQGESLNAAISTFTFNPEKLSEGGSKTLTTIVRSNLKDRHGERLIPALVVTEILDLIPKDKNVSLLEYAQRVGKAVNASHVMAGNVWRYKDRVSRGVGDPSPSTVGFGIYLIEVDTGRAIWRAFFDKTQTSLTENLLKVGDFLKAGGKWLSAEELTRLGVKDAFKKYPY